jgi:hypothetical protein
MQALKREELELRVGGDGVEFRTTELGGQSIAWVVLPKGTDFGPALKGLPGDMCQCPHWGYMIKGRLRMRTADGEQVYEAGQGFYWAPGHSPDALEDCEYIDISPTAEIEEVIAHVKAGG